MSRWDDPIPSPAPVQGVPISSKRNFLNAILLFASLQSGAIAADRAIDNNTHGWFNYFGDHPLGNSKWGLHLEGQYRRHDVLLQWQQLMFRPAVNYDVKKSLTLSAGYAFARSYSYTDLSPARPATNEHRAWEQMQWRYKAGRAALNSRFRLEQRFIGTGPVTSGYRYENRFRAWEQITVPMSRRTYFTAYDEVWFYIKPYVSQSILDQNRAFAGIGFRAKPSLRLETGYLNQALWQRSGLGLELNHTLVFSIYSNARIKLRP